MKQFIRIFFVALLFSAAGLGVGDAEAQRIYASENGRRILAGADAGVSCANPADPCYLEDLLTLNTGVLDGIATDGGTTNDTLAILVDAPGAMVHFDEAIELTGIVPIGFYMNNGTPTVFVAGTLKFSGNLTLGASGAVTTPEEKGMALIITSPQVNITAGSASNLPGSVTFSEPGRFVRITQAGTTDCLAFEDLTIAGRTQIVPTACGTPTEQRVTITKSLTVNAELQLQGNSVLEVTSAPEAKKEGTGFIAINSPDGISSFGGTLRLAVGEVYAEPDFTEEETDDIYKGKKAFHVRGVGPIELDLEVRSARYIQIDVSKIGAGGTSTIYAGTVHFGRNTMLDGSLSNRGVARTQFDGTLTISGGLTVDGRWIATAALATSNPILTDTDGILTPAEYTALLADNAQLDLLLDRPIVETDNVDVADDGKFACDSYRRPGVHLHHSTVIDGDVTFYNIAKQDTAGYNAEVTDDPATPDVDESEEEAGNYAVPCQAGLFLQGEGSEMTTVVKGLFKAQELNPADNAPAATPINTLGGYVYLHGTETDAETDTEMVAQHNLVLEGDVDISGTRTIVEMAMPASASEINGCSMPASVSGASGNKVIFGGSSHQTIKFSTDIPADGDDPAIDRTLELGALSMDKVSGSVEFSEGIAGVSVGYLEALDGGLTAGNSSGSLLEATTVVLSGTAGVENSGTGDVYRTAPTSIVYTGGDHTIGDERGGARTVTILSEGVVTVDEEVFRRVNLYAGTLRLTEEVTIDTLHIGNTGMFDVSGGTLKHTGPLNYIGDVARLAGAAWPSTDEMPEKATDTRLITIQQDCGDLDKPTLEVDLNAGYTAVGGNLQVWRGTLDLNGNTLILEERGDEEQWVSTGDEDGAKLGKIIDSQGAVAAAYEEDFERGDEFFAALQDIRQEYTEENGVALDRAVDALKLSGAAHADSSVDSVGVGGVIMVGRVPARKTDTPKTNFLFWMEKQSLPPIRVVGGEVAILGFTDEEDKPKAQVSMSSLTIGGDDKTHVHTREDVARLQVLGDLSMSTGKLTLNGTETVVGGNFMQTEGEVIVTESENAESERSLSVTGLFSIADSAKVTFGTGNELTLAGDVRVSGKVVLPTESMTSFIGTKEAQKVSITDTLGSVTVNSSGGLMLEAPVVQNAEADLTLQRGVVITGDSSSWVIMNSGSEKDLATRSAVPSGQEGTVVLGSRVSFFHGNIKRELVEGNSGTGDVKGGYLFPIGMLSSEGGSRNRYRPLIMNFAADLPPDITAIVSAYAGDVMWPEEGIEVPTEDGTLTLDTHSDIFWKVEMSDLLPLGATVRVAADGLTGVNEAKGLRLIQWDCDGSNARLAGDFDLTNAGIDDASVWAVGSISGATNTTIDHVNLEECNLFGLAANHAENPIGGAPPPVTPTASAQLIHNIVGATVDIYMGDVRIRDDFGFQEATSLGFQIAAGQQMVHVVPANAPDNSTPIVSFPVTLIEGGRYTLIANGDLTMFDFALLGSTRSEAVADNKVEFRLVHGAASLGEVDIRSLGESGLWANNIKFNEATGYRSADPTVHDVELLKGDSQVDVFEFDLGDYINQTLVLALSGAGMDAAGGLTLMGVDTLGHVFFPQVVTSAHSEELPTEFALQGNYPNPFNPSTQIQFDLPGTAEVTVQVVDLLGRMVLKVSAQSVEAGFNRTVELDGSSLASGTYLYRLIAEMESGVKVETGRMVLIK